MGCNGIALYGRAYMRKRQGWMYIFQVGSYLSYKSISSYNTFIECCSGSLWMMFVISLDMPVYVPV